MFLNMKPSEKRLLDTCQRSEIPDSRNERPTEKTADNEIRGEFLRALILSNNQEIDENGTKYILKIDPKGLNVQGAYISGTFDFSFCNTDLPFIFLNSVFEKEINISDAKIRLLNLHNSKVPGINGERLICKGSIFFKNGFEVNAKVNFQYAQMGGSLECGKGKMINKNADALNCNRAKIIGSVFFKNGFVAKGIVNFNSAQIGHNLECSNSKFINKNEIALNFDSAKINGNVFFKENLSISGGLNLSASQVRNLGIPNKIRIKANIYFLSMKVDTIIIPNIKFDQIFLKKKDFKLLLDGFKYNHLLGKNLDSSTLEKWLDKMPEFKPQPYKQLAKVLRNMGHHKEADDVMIEYNNKIFNKDYEEFKVEFKQAYKVALKEKWNFFKTLIKYIFENLGFLARQIYRITSSYGYRLIRVFITMFCVWFSCSLFYWNASKVAVFAPNNPLVFQKKDFYKCNINSDGTPWSDIFSWDKYNSTNNWVLNENLDGEYTTFNPFMYSLDVILPIVDLQVEKDWGQYVAMKDGTLNDFTRWLMWFEILFGWIYSLILVAILSGLAKNEKD